MLEASQTYFTSQNPRFANRTYRGEAIPLRRGAATIPPEISHLVATHLADYCKDPLERRLISEKKREDALREVRKWKPYGPWILYGSVAKEQATEKSDLDIAHPTVFPGWKVALFSPYQILNATAEEERKIHSDISHEQEKVLLSFMMKYRGRRVSAADMMLDYIHRNAWVAHMSSQKGTSPEIEEAKLLGNTLGSFLLTLQRLVKQGSIERYGYHEYQLVKNLRFN